MEKLFFRRLFRLIRKYGVALVLRGMIEFCKTDESDPRLKALAEDLEKALARYKNAAH